MRECPAGHLDRAWPGTGREPGQQVADERMSASPGAHHQLLLSCGPADAAAPPATARSGVHFRRARSGTSLQQQTSQAPGRVGRTQVHAVASTPSVAFRPGASWPLSRLSSASATLVTVSPPGLPAARKLEAKALHGCCGQRHSPHRFTDARIATIILIGDQTSCEVGIRSE